VRTQRISRVLKEAKRSQMTAKCDTVPPCRQPDDLFSQLVRKIVIHEHRGALRELAAALGLSYGALYNRLNGRAEFNPREINMLLRELADSRLVDCLLSGSAFVAIRKPEVRAPRSGEDVVNLALSCAVETLSAVHATVDAIRGADLNREREIEIEQFICRAQRNLSLLQVALSEARRKQAPTEELASRDDQTGKIPVDHPNRYVERRAPRSEHPRNKPLVNGVSTRSLAGILDGAQ
jgi:hypothetical protein